MYKTVLVVFVIFWFLITENICNYVPKLTSVFHFLTSGVHFLLISFQLSSTNKEMWEVSFMHWSALRITVPVGGLRLFGRVKAPFCTSYLLDRPHEQRHCLPVHKPHICRGPVSALMSTENAKSYDIIRLRQPTFKIFLFSLVNMFFFFQSQRWHDRINTSTTAWGSSVS